MKQDPILRNAKRILIITSGELGDIVLSLAAVEAIRNYHQHAHIVLFCEPEFNRFLLPCPFFDELVTNWRYNTLREDLDNRSQMQAAKFDAVYDLSGTDETAQIFKRFWPSKPKWSGVAPNCSHPHIDRAREKMHILDRHAEQLWLAGIGPKDGYPIGTSPLPNLDWVKSQITPQMEDLKNHGIDFPFAILAPEVHAHGGSSLWPSARYIELGKALFESGLRTIVVGGPNSISLGNEIRAGIPSALDLVARLDIFNFIALARHANLVVGSDGDLNIICGIIGAPVVSIINPDGNNIRQVSPRGPLTVSLVSRDFREIKVEQVLAAARAVM